MLRASLGSWGADSCDRQGCRLSPSSLYHPIALHLFCPLITHHVFTMAAPAELTSRDISGKFTMVGTCSIPSNAPSNERIQNKTLSDDSDEILRLQGVSWFTRKAISLATIYVTIKHYKDENGVEHIEADQTLTGGIKGTNEHRILDWTERTHEDHVFGPVLSKSRRVKLQEVEREWLKKDWLLDDSLSDGLIIYTTAKSDTEKSGTTWTSEQVRLSLRSTMCGARLNRECRYGASSKSMQRKDIPDMSTSRVPRARL